MRGCLRGDLRDAPSIGLRGSPVQEGMLTRSPGHAPSSLFYLCLKDHCFHLDTTIFSLYSDTSINLHFSLGNYFFYMDMVLSAEIREKTINELQELNCATNYLY